MSRVTFILRIATAVSLIFIAVLLAMPSTAPTARLAVRAATIGVSPHLSFSAAEDARVVRAHPADWELALAAILDRPDIANGQPETDSAIAATVARLSALEARFPGHPEIYAADLRLRAGILKVPDRPEFDAISGQVTASKDAPNVWPGSAADEFRRKADWGAKLDPRNAFFPVMRAAAQMAQHHDLEALASVRQATRRDNYDDYVNRQIRAIWRLHNLVGPTFGTRTMVTDLVLQRNTHLSLIRQAARLTIYNAIIRETQGAVPEGISLRHAVIRVGSLMRVYASNSIAGRFGISLEKLAVLRPGGAPPIVFPHGISKTAMATQRARAYRLYLISHGEAEEARWVDRELTNASAAADILFELYEREPFGRLDPFRLDLLWILLLVGTSAALWLWIFAIVGTIAARSFWRLADQYVAVRRWSILAACYVLLIIFGTVSALLAGWQRGDLSVLVITWLTLGAFAAVQPRLREVMYHNTAGRITSALTLAAFMGLLILAILGLLSVSALQSACLVATSAWASTAFALNRKDIPKPVVRLALLAFGISLVIGLAVFDKMLCQAALPAAMVASYSGVLSAQRGGYVVHFLCTIAALSVLMLVGLKFYTHFTMPMLSAGGARKLAGASIVLATILTFVCGWMIMKIAAVDNEERGGLTAAIIHEGRYSARVIGRPWPGLVPEPHISTGVQSVTTGTLRSD